ncbi:hypothetical protein BDV18DRAFT_143150 [Aspergillus unguis]
MSSSSDDTTAFGWAARVNGSCEASETDCGATVSPYRVCCPGGSYCPHAWNVACCPSESNCTEALQANPHCANETWDLYINGGYFCCEPGTTGYAKDGGSNGCGSPGYVLGDDETKLPIEVSGVTSTSTPTATPTSGADMNTTTPTTTSSSENQSSTKSTNTGAIAGGVIGGVAAAAVIAALLYLLFRTRRQLAQSRMAPMPQYTYAKGMPAEDPQVRLALAEMEGQRAAELGDPRTVAELPGYGR